MAMEVSLFIAFHTVDRLLECQMLDNSFTNVDWESSSNNEGSTSSYSLAFPVEDLSTILNRNQSFNCSLEMPLHFPGIPDALTNLEELSNQCQETSFHMPHRYFIPKMLPPNHISSKNFHCCLFQPSDGSFRYHLSTNMTTEDLENCKFVTPKQRCVIVVDAHVASCMKFELSHSNRFSRRFIHNIKYAGGFKKYTPHYKLLTSNMKNASDQCLAVQYMIEVFTVWPWQIVDHVWCSCILGLLNKHVVLEEGLAWLSTLGGAHSSLGETFMHHAERAGEISLHQLQLAKELGNEIMIARCYIYWSWSLLQRQQLTKSKICIRNTWKYCQKLKCNDHVLGNMCKAVWSRLRYEKTLCHQRKAGKSLENETKHIK